jgi:hypothetical protein
MSSPAVRRFRPEHQRREPTTWRPMATRQVDLKGQVDANGQAAGDVVDLPHRPVGQDDPRKTLATDTPDLLDVRRLSTRALRVERDRLAELGAACPPDRSRELGLAAKRAGEAEQARQEEVAALEGSWRRRGERAAARERLVLAEHALGTTSGQADQAAERLGALRRAQQRRLGWMEAHNEELRIQERAVAREAAWRRRVDQCALALDRYSHPSPAVRAWRPRSRWWPAHPGRGDRAHPPAPRRARL